MSKTQFNILLKASFLGLFCLLLACKTKPHASAKVPQEISSSEKHPHQQKLEHRLEQLQEKMSKSKANTLLTALKTGNKRSQRAAAEQVTAKIKDVEILIPQLVQETQKPPSSLHYACIEALGRLVAHYPKKIQPALIRALLSTDISSRRLAAIAIRNLKTKATASLPALLKVLPQSEINTQRMLIETIGKIQYCPPKASKMLMPFLKHPREFIRSVTVQALSKIGCSASQLAPKLSLLLQDRDQEVRKQSLKAFGKLGKHAKKYIPSITKCLEDSDEFVKEEAAKSLGILKLYASSALPTLKKELKKSDIELAKRIKWTIQEINNADKNHAKVNRALKTNSRGK